MDYRQVPQQKISTYADNKKAIYATDEKGRYQIVASSGWEAEAEATTQALSELKAQALAAYKQAADGEASPLYFHMYARRMDPQILAESVGMFRWRVRRHFKAKVFAGLSAKIIQRYAEALGIEPAALRALPPREEIDAAIL